MVNKDHRHSSDRGTRLAFVSRFQEVASSSFPSSDEIVCGQWISVVMRTDWVEILLMRTLKDPHRFSVEVEVSIPTYFPHNGRSAVTRKTPLDMIEHMQYLVRLQDAGFSLIVVGEEGLWLASKDFEEAPSAEILNVLMPPLVK
jgi:hypothetical protein